ncbi:uncharacterized protein [Montipora foliosa]|uniref:uncharacterized protein n=1 Tax=Montipora foliosa TaxID=591990 RepID=UPI0035F199AB
MTEFLETSCEGADLGRNVFCFSSQLIKSYHVGTLSEKQTTALNTRQILDVPTTRDLQDRISKLVERVVQLEATVNKGNVSTMSTNQSVDNPMDSCDTSEEKKQEKGKTSGRKRRK